MVLLMNPLAVALKIDLCGWACFAVQIHRLVLHNVSLFRFNEEVGQWLWRIRWKSFWKLMKKVVICKGKMKEPKFSWQTLAKTSQKIKKHACFLNVILETLLNWGLDALLFPDWKKLFFTSWAFFPLCDVIGMCTFTVWYQSFVTIIGNTSNKALC